MGKSSIVYVIGLSLIVSVVLSNINNYGLQSTNAFINYYSSTQAHNVAVAGANIGVQKALQLMAAPANFGVTYYGGYDTVLYASIPPRAGFDLTYNWLKVTSIASMPGPDGHGSVLQDTVEGVLRHDGFAEFGWFTEKEMNGYLNPDGTHGPYYGQADWKVTGDSVFGRAHTNGYTSGGKSYGFNLDGRPYFGDRVTAGAPPKLGPTANPIYSQGYEWGVHKQRPSTATLQTNLTNVATAGGALFDGGGTKDLSLTFQGTNVRVQTLTGAVINSDTTMPISSLTSNGAIVVVNGDLRVQGTYSGSLTIGAFKGTSGAAVNKGNVWFDGSLVAADNPQVDPNSTDMMGIVAGRMAYVSKNLAGNPAQTISIQAAIYCDQGELTAENFWTIPVSGRVSLFGSLTQISAGSLGVYNPGPPLTFTNGYNYSVRHDPRFVLNGPKWFPTTATFSLYSWWER